MGEWKETRLDKYIAYINRGITPKYTDDEGITILNQKCIRNGRINYDLARLHNPSKKITTEKKLVENDILINSTGVGTAGRVAIFDGSQEALVDSHVSILRLKQNDISPLFLFYNFKGREQELEETAEGSTGQIELKREGIRDLKIKLPKDILEQKTIAEVLVSLDDKIDLLHRQNKTLEDLAETLFRHTFINNAQDASKKGHLGSFCKVLGGYAFKSKDFMDSGLPVIKIKNISNNSVDISNVQYIPKGIAKTIDQKYRLNNGDIVIAMTGATIGKVGLVSTGSYEFLLLNQRVAVLRTEYPSLMWFLLNSLDIENSILNLSNGAAQANISASGIEDVSTPYFDKGCATKFEKELSPFFKKILVNKKQVQTIEKLRDTFLSKLMSGDVRVKYDEVA